MVRATEDAISGPGPFLFPSEGSADGYQKTLGVADEFVTQLLRQGDAKVFRKYSQMKLQMKREAPGKLNRDANESGKGSDTVRLKLKVLTQFWHS